MLPATAGEAFLLGEPIDAADLSARKRVGYMSQSFSLYTELTVRQNLDPARPPFPPAAPRRRVAHRRARRAISALTPYLDQPTSSLPLGIRQRLSLAVAIVHEPEMLILDEPTSGVDPLARDQFWELLIDLSRNQNVTIFVSTHFMNEAARCDRISLMHEGRVLATGTPAALTGSAESQPSKKPSSAISRRRTALLRRVPPRARRMPPANRVRGSGAMAASTAGRRSFSRRRVLPTPRARRLELLRDPIRLAFALLGTAFLMLIFGFGITTDVDNLSFAVLDRDQTPESRAYLERIQRLALLRREAADRRLRRPRAALAQRRRQGDDRDPARLRPRHQEGHAQPAVGAWIDGAMPFRAETIRGYLQGVHQHYLADLACSTTEPGSAPDRDTRDPLRLQPGFQERVRHGALDHGAPAGPDSRDPDGARRSSARRSSARSPTSTSRP